MVRGLEKGSAASATAASGRELVAFEFGFFLTTIFFSSRHSLSVRHKRPLRMPISAGDHGENIGARYPDVLKFGIAHCRKMDIVTMQLAPVSYSVGEYFQGAQHNVQQSAAWPMAVDFECRHLVHLYVFAPSQIPLLPTFLP